MYIYIFFKHYQLLNILFMFFFMQYVSLNRHSHNVQRKKLFGVIGTRPLRHTRLPVIYVPILSLVNLVL